MSTATTATTIASREVGLVARPDGEPRPDHFELVEAQLHAPADGQVLVRNTHLSVDPYMRGRMDDAESYIAPFPLDAPLDGAAIGPSNLSQLVTKRISVQGILVTDHLEKLPAYQAAAQEWLRDGRLRFRETVVDGLERMPDALLGLYRGDNLGKMVVRLED